MKTIPISDCYSLHVHTSDVPATGQRHLLIASTFTGAKDPHNQRTLFDVTLSPETFDKLAAAIKETT